MKGYKDDKASDEYYLLKKFNWLLFKNPEDEDKHGRLFDIERERKYNSHFKSYMNYYDLRKKLLEINNDLTICYSLKLELVDFYSKSTIDNAKVNLEHLIRSFIENRNKIIKCIKNNANGYTNWPRFRNRVMYVLDPSATFSLEPREK